MSHFPVLPLLEFPYRGRTQVGPGLEKAWLQFQAAQKHIHCVIEISAVERRKSAVKQVLRLGLQIFLGDNSHFFFSSSRQPLIRIGASALGRAQKLLMPLTWVKGESRFPGHPIPAAAGS